MKSHHCIVYTGSERPSPRRDEEPWRVDEAGNIEEGMLEPIRVQPIHPESTMDPMSRLNFEKVHTIEHNIKVAEFGNVDREGLMNLRGQLYRMWAPIEDTS